MSAIVCGKRSNSIFDELHTSPPVSKRFRLSAVSSSPTAARYSSPRPSSQSPSFDPSDTNAISNSSGTNYTSSLAHLRSLFPDMDQQFLERVLEEFGNDLDSAIRSLNDLCLESSEMKLGFAASKSNSGIETNVLPTEGNMNNGGRDAASENQSAATDNLPTDGSQWVDLLVKEMMTATDVDDARARASRVLEVLEKSIMSRADSEATENFHKGNVVLKEQVEVLLRENTILKRAVAIQHEQQKEYGERGQELQQLKQLVSHYQEQLRSLEVTNYALTMHLRQAQQSSSIPGRFHPDIF